MPQGLTLEQAQALGFKPKGMSLEEARAAGFQPGTTPELPPQIAAAKAWYERMFEPVSRDDSPSEVSLKQAGAVAKGVPSFIKGMVWDLPQKAGEIVGHGLMGNTKAAVAGIADLGKSAVGGIAQPFEQVGRGVGEILVPGTQPKAAPESPEWNAAAQNAGANMAGLLLGRATQAKINAPPKTILRSHAGETLPTESMTGKVVKAVAEKLPRNNSAPLINKWIGVEPKEMMHGSDPGARLISEKLIGATKEATKAKIAPALEDAGKAMDVKLKAATKNGTVIDGETVVLDAVANASKKIGLRTDKVFQAQLENIVNDIVKDYPDLKKLTPEQAHSLKVEIGDSTKWNGLPYEGDINQVFVDIYSGLNDKIKTGVKGIAADQARWGDLYQANKALKKGMVKDAAGSGTGKYAPTLIRRTGKALAKIAIPTAIGGVVVNEMRK